MTKGFDERSSPFYFEMLIRRFMRVFFHLLYHPFAFTYDLVAATVSFGRWNSWIQTVIPYIEGTHILELGHGPGHLQRVLLNRNLLVFGLDESTQMGRLAKQRLAASAKLTRGLAQNLPFARNAFQTVISTFPTDYIFDPQTLSEVKRCLSDRGRLIVLPAAWPKSRILQWLYKVTGEGPENLSATLKSRMEEPFKQAGFITESQVVESKSSNLLIILARKAV